MRLLCYEIIYNSYYEASLSFCFENLVMKIWFVINLPLNSKFYLTLNKIRYDEPQQASALQWAEQSGCLTGRISSPGDVKWRAWWDFEFLPSDADFSSCGCVPPFLNIISVFGMFMCSSCFVHHSSIFPIVSCSLCISVEPTTISSAYAYMCTPSSFSGICRTSSVARMHSMGLIGSPCRTPFDCIIGSEMDKLSDIVIMCSKVCERYHIELCTKRLRPIRDYANVN